MQPQQQVGWLCTDTGRLAPAGLVNLWIQVLPSAAALSAWTWLLAGTSGAREAAAAAAAAWHWARAGAAASTLHQTNGHLLQRMCVNECVSVPPLLQDIRDLRDQNVDKLRKLKGTEQVGAGGLRACFWWETGGGSPTARPTLAAEQCVGTA